MHPKHRTSEGTQPGNHRSLNLPAAKWMAAGTMVVALAAAAHAAPPQPDSPDRNQRLLLQQIAELLNRYVGNSRAPARRPATAGTRAPAQPDSTYIQGLRDGYAAGLLDSMDHARKQNLLRNRERAVKAGLLAFRGGRYDRAADMFLLACELDHADPAGRLHAAQALFALGQYQEAIRQVRRAFELQPKLVYLKFDLRRDYGNPKDFAMHLRRFRRYLAKRPKWSDGHLLMGYQLLYSGQRARAHDALRKAAALRPSDRLVQKMLKASIPLPADDRAKSGPTTRPARDTANRA